MSIAAPCRAAARAERLLAEGRAAEALAALAAASAEDAASAPLLALSARILIALGRPDLAIGALHQALEREPVAPGLLRALAILLLGAGHPAQALAHAIAAFEQDPTADAGTLLAAVLAELGMFEQAEACTAHAIGQAPTHWEAWVNHAIALHGQARHGEAAEAGRHALSAAPDEPRVRYNLACTLLGLGQLSPEAWDLFEARLRLPGNPGWVGDLAASRWTGGDISGRTILLHAEQGFGDTLQFLRYVPMVAARAGRVVLAVQRPLLRLLTGLRGADAVVAADEPLPPFDVACPLLSLPGLLGTTLATIPPVLPLPSRGGGGGGDAAVGKGGPRRVGLAWQGSRTFKDDRHRSLGAEDLVPLAGVAVRLVSLQLPDAIGPACPPGLVLEQPLHPGADFADTAAVIAGLDLVISVDTAVAHLAGTLGVPVWLLSRRRGCWRWMHERADTPWYPAVRIIRQGACGWPAVMEAVRAALEGGGPPP